MTIPLKPWMAGLAIALFCVLLGFSIGQITTAQSAKEAATSARALIVQDRAVLTQLKKLNRSIGGPSSISSHPSNLLNEIDDIRTNTGEVCWELTMQMSCED